MQVLHLLIATASVFVIVRYAPLSHTEKVLTVFGYFLFYEYATISRDYALGILWVFCFCASFRAGLRKRYGLLFFLILVADSNIYAIILAISLAFMIMFESLQREESPKYIFLKGKLLLCALVFFVAVVLLSLLPPASSRGRQLESESLFSGAHPRWIQWDTSHGLVSHQFWNTNFLGEHFRVMAPFSPSF